MKKLAFLLVLMVWLTTACGARSEYISAPMPQSAWEQEESDWAGAAAENQKTADAAAPRAGNLADIPDRMIVYNASLDLVVKDTQETQQAVETLIVGLDGYVASSESYRYAQGLLQVNVTLRVPAERFYEAMDQLRGLAMEVTRDSISSQDVTQEYVDLASRLRALEVKAERLEELMEQAEDTEAVLAIYEHLTLTQQEIEQTKGRMQYLERTAAMATIIVSLTPDELSQAVEIAGWRPQDTLKRAVEALIQTAQFLADALIWIVIYILPILSVLGLASYGTIRLLIFIVRRLKPKGKRSAEQTPPAAT